MKNKKINMRKRQFFLVASLSIMSMTAMAQMEEPQKDTITLLQEQIDENRGKIKTLEKYKVSGYIQAQAELQILMERMLNGSRVMEYVEEE